MHRGTCWRGKEFNVRGPNEIVMNRSERWGDVPLYTCNAGSFSNHKLRCPQSAEHVKVRLHNQKHCQMNLSAPLREEFDFAHPELRDYKSVNSTNVVYIPSGTIVHLKNVKKN